MESKCCHKTRAKPHDAQAAQGSHAETIPPRKFQPLQRLRQNKQRFLQKIENAEFKLIKQHWLQVRERALIKIK